MLHEQLDGAASVIENVLTGPSNVLEADHVALVPIASMPKWAQIVARSNPLSYFMEIMRMIYLKGSSYTGIAAPLLSLLGFAVGFNTWAVLSYSKSEN